MKLQLVTCWILCLLSCTLYSQDKKVFKPSVKWLTLEEALALNPDSVFHLNLEKHKLENNELPKEIYLFKNLESLSLRGLKLTDFPAGINMLTSLKFLDISKNKLDVFPLTICKLSNLEVLVAHKNPLTYLPHAMGMMTNLKYIDLWETPVTDLPESMEELEFLVYIDLQGVNINYERQESLRSRFPKVKFELDPPCNCFH